MLDRQPISAGWTARGFSCDLWTDPPGQCWEDFTHPTDELVVVLEGEMEFEIAGQVHHPAVGDLRAPSTRHETSAGPPPAGFTAMLARQGSPGRLAGRAMLA
jgi:quercetin dioxygenase-like cupin family protein